MPGKKENKIETIISGLLNLLESIDELKKLLQELKKQKRKPDNWNDGDN